VSDAAARDLAAGPLPPASPDHDAAMYAFNDAKARGATSEEAIRAFYKTLRPGEPPQADPARLPGFMRFVGYLRTGQKAGLVEDGLGQVLIPEDVTIDILREARRTGTIRSLASVRPTVRDSQVAGLLGVPTVTWGKLELGTSLVDANILPENPPQVIDVHDVQCEAQVGVDLLEDSPEAARAAIVEAVGAAIGESEDAKFAGGSGSGEPSGLSLAANVSRVPSGQKLAVSTSNTPTAAQLLSLPWKLHSRYRDDAVWLLHPGSAEKVAALTFTNGDAVWPQPGPQGPGLLGWPAYVLDGLPDPATAGTGDASIWFVNLRAAYRVVARSEITVTRIGELYATAGIVSFVVKVRVGGELIRPAAAAIYTQ
jgi:HK97 family phage major capsid protein